MARMSEFSETDRGRAVGSRPTNGGEWNCRLETAADHEAIRHVNRLSFGRDDEAGIVDALRSGGYAHVSLIAEVNGEVVGHILFSDLPILTDNGTIPALSLAPMAVLPEYQKQGIGSALVRKGLEVCRDQGHRIVVVLGHAHFYPRFGFSAKRAEPLSSPFGGHDSWMALELVPGALEGIRGWVLYPPPFGIGVQIRPVYRPDQDEWVRMRTALWPDDGASEHAEEVAAFFANNTFRWSESLLSWKIFVAERPAGGLCGFVEASIRAHVDGCSTHPVGYVEGWYVDPAVRRQGIGRKLAEAAERWAAMQGCKEMASDAHLMNTVSHAAHKALGFEETERLVHFRKALSDSHDEVANHSFVTPRLKLLGVAGSFAVCKLATESLIPPWATTGDLFSVTRTADELSVVCPQEVVPEGVACERGWRCLRVAGSMPFTLVGVLAALTTPVAKAGVGVFAFSTFDTDYLLVKAADMPKAVAALRAAGHRVDAEGVVP
jgi:putative acetyltransferase